MYSHLTININLSCVAIRAKQYAVSRGSALTFPQPGDLDNTSFTGRTASVSIPNELLSERAKSKDIDQ